jgi:hypothetical protein
MTKLFSPKKFMVFCCLIFIICLLGTCSSKKQEGTIHLNEEECQKFYREPSTATISYFSGQSAWKSDINIGKLQAFKNAQAQLAAALESNISSICVEKSKSRVSDGGSTNNQVQQFCQTVVSSKNIDVSALSNRSSFCDESKKYVVAGKKKTAHRVSVRITVSDVEFNKFIRSNFLNK